jgi:NADH:ubiquinone oxidoreductase subunit E
MKQAVDDVLATHNYQPHRLVEMLQDLQQEFGYLPEDTLRAVSGGLRVPEIEVYRVARFYKSFSLEPRGRHTITACLGTACHVRGAPRLLDECQGQLGVEPGETTDDGLFTLECVNCLGACALGPVIVLDGEYHGHMTPAKLRSLLQAVRKADKEVAHAKA